MAYDSSFEKDPDAVLDYTRDWTTYLNGDAIATSTFIVPAGITKDSETNDTTSATVWLSGGADGEYYLVTNRITTAAGRTDDRSFLIYVKEQ